MLPSLESCNRRAVGVWAGEVTKATFKEGRRAWGVALWRGVLVFAGVHNADYPFCALTARRFGPNFTIERADLQQLLVLIDLVLDIEPVLANDFVIRLEDVDEGFRGSRCTTDDSIKEVDFIGGERCEIGY